MPLEAEIEVARKFKEESLTREEEEKIDPEVKKAALEISADPLLFKRRIDAVNQLGVVGERGTISMYFCALDSRLLPFSSTNSNALAVKNAGHFGSGKSFSLMSCIELYPKPCYHLITNGSGKSIYYLKEGLKHKALVVTEAFQFQKNNAADSELVYSIRALLSEGNLTYLMVGKDNDGNLTTFEKKLEGPTSFITTTIVESLEAQFEDRLFTIHPDESVDQTKRIIMMNMAKKAGKFQGLDQKAIDSWKMFHESLKPVDVLIPYAEDIGRFITKDGNPPLATRRASNRVMTVIQSIACAYQHQRKRDGQDRVIAEMCDYWMALQIVQDAFRENMGAQDKKTEKYLEGIREKERITPGKLAKMFGVAGASISWWSSRRISSGMIEWVDENGYYFSDDNALETAKKKGMAYLKISENYQNETVKGLPTPFDLTGDSRWKEGGDLLKLYDLNLEKRTAVRSVLGVQNGPNTVPNTSKADESIDFIDKSSNSPEGVRVLGQKSRGEENIFEEEEKQDGKNGGASISAPEPNELGDEHLFEDSTPEPKPRKRKSIFEQLGIQRPEKRELTEEERRKVDKLVAEFKGYIGMGKRGDIGKALGSDDSF
jgi:hypothetical protein